LLADAWRGRLRRLRQAPVALGGLRRARAELVRGPSAAGARALAPRTSLNRATGRRRALHRTEVDLAALRATGHAAGATVNDCLLVAAADALGTVLGLRGERPDASRKAGPRGASAGLLGPAFRALARLGLFGAMVDRQRLVNTFVTNLRGPTEPLALAGATVRDIVPITTVMGNVSVAFAALSYAGRLGVTVITDPDVAPEGAAIAAALGESLTRLAAGRP
ncbi:MAG TPA: WS/DGAT domain-containing protein, partial [Actinotalea sp.]|nr:WS/DGAT domain-containing protein [Actinotalea sp.]